MKGRLVEDVQNSPYLIRKGCDRFGENAGVAVLKALDSVGLFGSLRPMETDNLAAAMISLSKGNLSGAYIFRSQDIMRI